MKSLTIMVASVAALGLVICGCDESEETGKKQVSEPSTTTAELQRPEYVPSFVTFDRNGDKEVTRKEFDEALKEHDLFGDLDGDGDGELTDVEFETSFYRAWDINGDEVVDIDEYKDGSGVYFRSAHAYGTFEDYDNDGDEELTLTEYGVLASKVHDDWDGDGNGELTDLEYRNAMYNAWDLNGDGIVDHYEYRWAD